MRSKKNKNQKVEAYLKKKAQEYIDLLCLTGYHQPRFKYTAELASKAYMEIERAYPYRFINIHYCDEVVKSFNERDYDILDRCLLHEMVHLVLGHLHDKGSTRSTAKEIDDALEDTVEHITAILRR